MVSLFHNKVTLRGFHFEDFHLTVNLAAGITTNDVGKGVTWDTSSNNKMKLAGDGDEIVARLETVEDRKVDGMLVGAVEFRFANVLPIKSGLAGAEAVVVGSTVVGAGAGEVKARVVSSAAAPDYNRNYVAEIIGTNAVVVKL